MPSICLYFQVHQPKRIRNYNYFDIKENNNYFDDKKNLEILNKVSEKCYLITNEILLKLINKHGNQFRISFSLSGIFLQEIKKHRPDVLKSFKKLVDTGCVEILNETYSHSLCSIFSLKEFNRQIEKHQEIIKNIFNYNPSVFRNTELIYHNKIAKEIENLGYKGILCEGSEKYLNNRNPNHIYKAKNCKNMKLLLKNYRLSDDIAFRFSDKNSGFYPLTTDKYIKWINEMEHNSEVINLFMDYETFGEHQWKESGIFEFINQLPEQILNNTNFDFKNPTECISFYKAVDTYDVNSYLSWADSERDISAWLGNSLQAEALKKIYSIEDQVMSTNDKALIEQFEYLQTSDHFYYMSTKYWNDGDVHKYFSPYDSPYEAYIYFMNVFSDFQFRVNEFIKNNGTSERIAQEENSFPQASIVKN
jgi:alpha-amylase